MESYGFDPCFLQPVMVPHWVRGAKRKRQLLKETAGSACISAALGMSVATPANGITAPVIKCKA